MLKAILLRVQQSSLYDYLVRCRSNMEQERAEISVRMKDGMSYFYKNVKVFQVTANDYVIVHNDGSQRMINRQGVIDIVIAPDSAGKITDSLETIGSA